MSRAEPSPAPRWLAGWLALLPPLYIISPLSLLGLPGLRRLPAQAQALLGFYAASQLLPAALAPDPALALLGGLLRTALMTGLIGLGAWMGDSARTWPISIGLLVTGVVAVAYSLTGGLDLLAGRLAHPLMTSITLGLGGALAVWLAAFVPPEQWPRTPLLWRGALLLTGAALLVASGSRGALLAAALGLAAGYTARAPRHALGLLAAGALLLGGVLAVGEYFGIGALTRLATADTTGRDLVWGQTLEVIRHHPLAGVGSYRLGDFLAPLSDTCTTFSRADGSFQPCPAWLERLGQPWRIAHNFTLQQLAETGPLGLAGLLGLMTAALYAAWQRRDSLGLAVLGGLTAASVTDNTLLVPTPFFGEMFWLVVGVQLAYLPTLPLRAAGLGAALGGLLSLPLLGSQVARPPTVTDNLRLDYLAAPPQGTAGEPYHAALRLLAPAGKYRVSVQVCPQGGQVCRWLSEPVSIAATEGSGTSLTELTGRLPRQPGTYRLNLDIRPWSSSFNLTPLARHSWTVEVQKAPATQAQQAAQTRQVQP